MYLIVVGAGKIGYYLAQTLIGEGYEVLLIEKNPRRVEIIEENFGSIIMQGDGAEVTVLEAAGAARADVVIATTGDDEDNLIICQIAKRRFKVDRTIARVNNPKNERLFKTLGIDATISQTSVILHLIEAHIPDFGLTHLLTLRHAEIDIVEVRVGDASPVAGRTLADVQLPPDCVFSAITRGPEVLIPSGQTRLQAGDQVIAVVRKERESDLRRLLVGS